MMHWTKRAALAICLVLAVGIAAGPAGAATLSDADRAAVSRAETYLNTVHTMKSRFVQLSSGGQVARGVMWLARPNHMRIDYDPPQTIRLIADGHWLIHLDTALNAPTYVPLSSTPAAVLVDKEIKLSGDVAVTGVEHRPGTLAITMVRREEADNGRLTLVFTTAPMALRQWIVVDPQGVETRVSLLDPEFNQPVDPKLFAFDPDKYAPPLDN